jgi:hypothetical protein
MKECVRCWIGIKDKPNRLWCDKCVKLVKAELEWKIDKPLGFYFKDYYKRQWKSKNTI